MGFFDKVKDTVQNASDQAKKAYDSVKEQNAQKKAEKEAYEKEMTEKAQLESEERSKRIIDGFSGVSMFENINMDELLKFTNEFYSKLVLPAASLDKCCIDMYHYIDERVEKKIKKAFPEHETDDTVILYLRINKKTEVILTKTKVCYSDTLEEDNKYHVIGNVPLEKISELSVDYKGENCIFLVNGQPVLTIESKPYYVRDFISIDHYIDMIKKQDFVIEDTEVDAIIREKIGSKVYEEVKRKMTYDDELLLYFAWGLDSITAKDFMFCSDKQIVYLNREALGATADVKQFYYEDINSMATLQNSQDTSLTGYLIDTALTSALQLCDLEITVAGSKMKISTLKKREADRVVEIYHQQRKNIKEQARQPQVVMQQKENDPLEQLEKLNKLKEAGIITEEEFTQKKADLLQKL